MPASDPGRPVMLRNLGLYARGLGQNDLAIEYLTRSHEACEQHLPEDHVDRILAALDLGETRAHVGDLDESLVHLDQAIDGLRRRPGSRPDLRALAHGCRGVVLMHLD